MDNLTLILDDELDSLIESVNFKAKAAVSKFVNPTHQIPRAVTPKKVGIPIQKYDWGKECFLHDPSGILWHIGEFS